MKYFVDQKDFLLEKSIGSEAIRLKWYPDIEKRLFYTIVNLDPTSVRKKEFSKPGKYSKWLLSQFKKGLLPITNMSDEEKNKLSEYLFIFSTGFYKNKNVSKIFIGGSDLTDYSKIDIYRFKTLNDFISHIDKFYPEWKSLSEQGKYDLLYEDDAVMILVPLDYTACRKYSLGTEWCSQSLPGYNMWSLKAFLYRFIPKDKTIQKCRLTWFKNEIHEWSWASKKYPEFKVTSFIGDTTDLDHNQVVELIKKRDLDPFNFDKFDYHPSVKDLEQLRELEKMWKTLTPEAVKACRTYYLNSK